MAIAGGALSLSVHGLALLGFYSEAMAHFQFDLSLGVLPVFLLAFLAQECLLSEFSWRDRIRFMFNPRFSYKVMWRLLLGRTPKWLRVISIALFVYTLARFVILAYETFPAKSPSELGQLQLISLADAVFYSAAAMILMSYARTERPLRANEL